MARIVEAVSVVVLVAAASCAPARTASVASPSSPPVVIARVQPSPVPIPVEPIAATAGPPAPRAPRCVLRSEKTLDVVPTVVSVDGVPFATGVLADVTVAILDGDDATVRAERDGIVLEGHTTVAGMQFHRRSLRRGGLVQPLVLTATRFDAGKLRGRFELPSRMVLERPLEQTEDIPCEDATFGFVPHDRVDSAGPDRELLREKQDLVLRDTHDGPPAARITLDGVVGVDVLERRRGRLRVRWLHDAKQISLVDGTYVEGWIDVAAVKKLPKPSPADDASLSIVTVGGPPTAKTTIPVHACARDLTLSVDTGAEVRAAGRAKAKTRIAFGPAAGGAREIVGAVSGRFGGQFFSPMVLARGVRLVAEQSAIDAADCSEVGTWKR